MGKLPVYLKNLESESIYILREVLAAFKKPVLMYSIGKDSSVLLHLAAKAFYPQKIPFPVLHIDTGWKFKEMIKFRDEAAKRLNLDLIVYRNEDNFATEVSPFIGNQDVYTRIMKTEALKQALEKFGFDAAIGGARRDEEKSRSKERVFSVRTMHNWDPRNQRPEFWHNYNTFLKPEQSFRIFPLSDWTEYDVWNYIAIEKIPVVPLYFAKARLVVEKDGYLIMIDDNRFPLTNRDKVIYKQVRFRTLGCYPLTAAIESEATDIYSLIDEVRNTSYSERRGRLIDHDQESSMEAKKKEGYF